MTKKKAARRLKQLIAEIYNKLSEVEDILKKVDPEGLRVEEAYWISQIDEALLSLLEDALGILEEDNE